MNRSRGLLLTGGTGYLGSLIASTLLVNEDVEIILPIREGHDADSVLLPIRIEIEIQGSRFLPEHVERLRLVKLPSLDSLHELDTVVRESGVDQIIHCAGCLDYFDRTTLEAVNVDFTRHMLEHGRRWDIQRFVYISTAFSSGYIDGFIPEQLHEEPPKDPTDYTRTKREAEHLVANSGIPYLIMRPSIVIGDSRDGHYSGKQYGLYQLWSGMERLLCREWYPEMHVLAPRQPVSLVHQDAFQQTFLAACRLLPDNTIFNLVSAHETSPGLRGLWDLWVNACFRPQSLYCYEKMSDIPMRQINTRQRALLALASVNLEIASHPWRFETNHLARLVEQGLEFPHATLESVAICQQRFIDESSTIQEYLVQNREHFAPDTEIFDMATSAA
ncbi:SDR family oxidoreductase [Candidatus Entotheonella palauensis]|uniref:SDR family oxidoreductase n=1 Tax=Candidatus Entotheonella palauensis TaxID=93172 RepID=UPI000B7FA7DF|nr:SDR family oxidoreductase [Candidatus Entotheonella palauensis]